MINSRFINNPLLKKIFKRQKVLFAYLFGSQAKGKTGLLSDIDIAVYLDRKVSRQDYFNIKLIILGELMDIFKTNNIDVVLLNEAPPLLAHRILKEGKLFFSISEKKRLEFETKAILRYLDWKPYLTKYAQEVFG